MNNNNREHEFDTSHSWSGHGNFKSYVFGYIASILLTIAAFAMVLWRYIDDFDLILTIVGLGILQVIIQLRFFLHLGRETKPRWNLQAFFFTTFVVMILVFGTLWIMHNIYSNTM